MLRTHPKSCLKHLLDLSGKLGEIFCDDDDSDGDLCSVRSDWPANLGNFVMTKMTVRATSPLLDPTVSSKLGEPIKIL